MTAIYIPVYETYPCHPVNLKTVAVAVYHAYHAYNADPIFHQQAPELMLQSWPKNCQEGSNLAVCPTHWQTPGQQTQLYLMVAQAGLSNSLVFDGPQCL